MMKNLLHIIISVTIVSNVSMCLQAKVHSITTQKRLDQLLLSHEVSLVNFYYYDRRDKDRCSRAQNVDVHAVFNSISKVPRYKEAGVAFIEANIALPALQHTGCEYDIAITPTFMIFKDGDPYVQYKQEARLEGCASKSDLMALLDDNVGDLMRRIIKAKEETRRRNMAENLWWYDYYGNPWYGYCRPWYGSGYYYGPSCWQPWYNSCGSGAYLNFGVNFCR
jgi:hypothetical protein